jgi:hypothetical protein
MTVAPRIPIAINNISRSLIISNVGIKPPSTAITSGREKIISARETGSDSNNQSDYNRFKISESFVLKQKYQ